METKEWNLRRTDLKYRANVFQIEGFMTNDSFSETVGDNSAAAFVKFPTIKIKSFNGQPDSFECAIDKNDTLSDI